MKVKEWKVLGNVAIVGITGVTLYATGETAGGIILIALCALVGVNVVKDE